MVIKSKISLLWLKFLFILTLSSVIQASEEQISPSQELQIQLDEDLIKAAKLGDYEKAKKALDKGASPNASWGAEAVLSISAKKGHTALVMLLIQYKANIDQQGPWHWKLTALHEAARKGRLACCKALLNAGANPNLKDHKDYTPLHWAVMAPNYAEKITELFLKYKMDPNDKAEKDFNKTPLHLVTSEKAAIILLNKNADMNAQIKYSKATPTEEAVKRGNPAIVYALKIRGAKYDKKFLIKQARYQLKNFNYSGFNKLQIKMIIKILRK